MLRQLIPSAVLLLAIAACFVPSVDLSGKACDTQHACTDGFVCLDGRCVEPASDGGTTENPDGGAGPDAGLDGGEPTCSGSGTSCDEEERFVACESGRQVVLEDCSATTGYCDPRFGCLGSCVFDGCGAGEGCDEALSRCVDQPVCSGGAGCSDGANCVSGACLPPSSAAIVGLPDGGSAAAELGCYPVVSGESGPEVTLRGFLVAAGGAKTPRTIGYSLSLYRESDWVTGAAPFVEVTVGSRDNGSGTQVGSFNVAAVPSDVELVAVSTGTDGIQTNHYFRVPSSKAVSGVVDLNLVSHERAIWDALEGASGETVGFNRGGIDGQLFDCRSPARLVSGATAALDVASRAHYTLPGMIAVDSEATSTANNGRLFFFDVPAMTLKVVVGMGPGVTVNRVIRTDEDSVTVLTFAPAE